MNDGGVGRNIMDSSDDGNLGTEMSMESFSSSDIATIPRDADRDERG